VDKNEDTNPNPYLAPIENRESKIENHTAGRRTILNRNRGSYRPPLNALQQARHAEVRRSGRVRPKLQRQFGQK
jgi:hypothetical protein